MGWHVFHCLCPLRSPVCGVILPKPLMTPVLALGVWLPTLTQRSAQGGADRGTGSGPLPALSDHSWGLPSRAKLLRPGFLPGSGRSLWQVSRIYGFPTRDMFSPRESVKP